VESSLTGILPIRDQVAARAKTWCSGYIIAVSLQAEDKMLKPYILYLKEGILPKDRKLRRKLLDEIMHYTIYENVLYHIWKPDAKNINRGHLKKRTVIPESLKLEVMKKAHEESGHYGPWKTLELLRERCYWNNMSKDVIEHIQFCESCQRLKSNTSKTYGEMELMRTYEPWEMICIDWIGPISPVSRGFRYILMIVDYHTQWPEAFPTQ
jgi:hypothetical protein